MAYLSKELLAKRFTRKRALIFMLKTFRNLAVGVLAFLVLWAMKARNKPDLKIWHNPLKGEFTKSDVRDDFSFADYLILEDALFQRLEDEVVTQPETEADGWALSRYMAGSPSYPREVELRNWNRTQVLEPAGEPTAGVLLLHGLTDAPYSMLALGKVFQGEGALAICLRVPGHGTVPGALTKAKWRDWRAAMRLSLTHLKKAIPDGAPIYLLGYSNGGALALKHTLDAAADEELVMPKKVFLLNPAIGVSSLASLSDSHKPLSWMPWFKKFKWVDVLPEYDAFKYNSFPKNAGEQSYRLSQQLIKDLAKLQQKEAMKKLPPIVTFQSILDATVSVPAVVKVFYEAIENKESELFFFDINRFSPIAPLLKSECKDLIPELSQRGDLSYRLSVLTNVNAESLEMSLKQKSPGTKEMTSRDVGLNWPEDVYSLSHVAVPFHPDDPLYGYSEHPAESSEERLSFRIGSTIPRGERGGLTLSMDNLMRLRANPFFDVMEERIKWHLKN